RGMSKTWSRGANPSNGGIMASPPGLQRPDPRQRIVGQKAAEPAAGLPEVTMRPTLPACLALLLAGAAALAAMPAASSAQAARPGPPAVGTDLDARVRAFLDSRRGQWRDMNVPVVDGRTLHDII